MCKYCWGLVAPDADAVVLAHAGPVVRDLPPRSTHFNLPAIGADAVKAHHAVVLMLAQHVGQRCACGQRPLKSSTYIGNLLDFKIDVVQFLRHFGCRYLGDRK